MPRSKSTLVYTLLFHYFSRKYLDVCSRLGYFLDEHRFNVFYNNYYDNKGIFVYRTRSKTYQPGFYKEVPKQSPLGIKVSNVYADLPPVIIQDEIKYRTDLLLKNPIYRYFVKGHISDYTTIFLPQLCSSDFKLVCTTRNDSLNQFLEFMLSSTIGIFHSFDSKVYNYPKEQIIVQKSHVERFFEKKKQFDLALEQNNNKKIVRFEEAVSVPAIYEILNISDWGKYISDIRITHEPSYKNIEKYFQNIPQIEQWFDQYLNC